LTVRISSVRISGILLYYKHNTIFQAVRYNSYCHFHTRGPRKSPQYLVWPIAIESLETHALDEGQFNITPRPVCFRRKKYWHR